MAWIVSHNVSTKCDYNFNSLYSSSKRAWQHTQSFIVPSKGEWKPNRFALFRNVPEQEQCKSSYCRLDSVVRSSKMEPFKRII